MVSTFVMLQLCLTTDPSNTLQLGNAGDTSYYYNATSNTVVAGYMSSLQGGFSYVPYFKTCFKLKVLKKRLVRSSDRTHYSCHCEMHSSRRLSKLLMRDRLT